MKMVSVVIYVRRVFHGFITLEVFYIHCLAMLDRYAVNASSVAVANR